MEHAASRLNGALAGSRVQFLANREVPRQRVLPFMLDHTTHDRGRAIVYMRINGVRPPQYRVSRKSH